MGTAKQTPSVFTFDWKSGFWSASSTSEPTSADKAILCIAGDWAPIRAFQGIIEASPESIYGDLLPLLRNADLSVVNLEAPLSDVGDEVWKSGAVFKGEKKHVQGLSAVPFHAVTLGNNHMFDFGTEAFRQTLEALNEKGIQYTGAGENLDEAATPLVMTVNGLKIAIVNFSEGEDLTAAEDDKPGVMGWDPDRMESVIRELKTKGHKEHGTIDFIMVIAHCGIEYIPFPPMYVAKMFERMVDAGADAVIGHHPHVPQGIRFYKGVPIFYSLGNFVFYQPTTLKYRKMGYMVNLGIENPLTGATAGTEDPGGTAAGRSAAKDIASSVGHAAGGGDTGKAGNALISIELVPYEIHDRGVRSMKEDVLAHFYTKFEEISRPLNDPDQFESTWNAFLHYYGTKGFLNEIAMISDRIKSEPRKGAAMFRNRLTTLQHYHHWKDLLHRMVQGNLEESPQWARDIVDEWLTMTLDVE